MSDKQTPAIPQAPPAFSSRVDRCTKAVIDEVVKAVQLGMRPSAAAKRSGVTRVQFRRWMSLGEMYLDDENAAITPPEYEKYAQFYLAMTRSQGDSQLRLMIKAQKAAELDPAYAIKLLSMGNFEKAIGIDEDPADVAQEKAQTVNVKIVYPDDVPEPEHELGGDGDPAESPSGDDPSDDPEG